MWTRYLYATGDAPELDEADYDAGAVRAAGQDPDDEEVTVCVLAEAWHGHAAGSRVVIGLTVDGHPMAVETQHGEYRRA